MRYLVIKSPIYLNNSKMTYTIQEINEVLKGTIIGNTSIKITAPEQLELASDSEISFIGKCFSSKSLTTKVKGTFLILLISFTTLNIASGECR